MIKYMLNMSISFVSDLLDMRMFDEGFFEGEDILFCPTQSFEIIKEIFSCQSSQQKTSIMIFFLDKLEWSDISKDLVVDKKIVLPNLLGDQRRLQQILINLVKNSLKFSKDKGYIRIYVAYDNL